MSSSPLILGWMEKNDADDTPKILSSRQTCPAFFSVSWRCFRGHRRKSGFRVAETNKSTKIALDIGSPSRRQTKHIFYMGVGATPKAGQRQVPAAADGFICFRGPYAMRECFHGENGIAVTQGNVLGVLSLMLWSLLTVVASNTIRRLIVIFLHFQAKKVATFKKCEVI